MAVSVATVLLLAALFAGDSVWTALVALLVAGGWSALALAGRAPQPAGGVALLGVLLATAAWAGLSLTWSVAPDRSWAELDRTLVFAAFLVVGLLLGASGPRACRWAAAALVTALGAAVVWALAGKAIPALFPDGGRAARLRDPIGYWNALALAADMLLVLALQLAVRQVGRARPLAVGTMLAYAASSRCPALASRAGVAAAAARLSRSGSGSAATESRPRCSRSPPCAAGRRRGGVGVQPSGARRRRVPPRRPCRRRRLVRPAPARRRGRGRPRVLSFDDAHSPWLRAGRVGRSLAGARVVAVLVGAVATRSPRGQDRDEFRGAEVTNEPGRFGSLSSNNRLDWWGEAWDIFAADPLVGAGAGTLRDRAEALPRRRASAVTQPHSVPLQFLAGTGLVGLALFARARWPRLRRCGWGAPAARGRRTGRCGRAVRRARPLARRTRSWTTTGTSSP